MHWLTPPAVHWLAFPTKYQIRSLFGPRSLQCTFVRFRSLVFRMPTGAEPQGAPTILVPPGQPQVSPAFGGPHDEESMGLDGESMGSAVRTWGDLCRALDHAPGILEPCEEHLKKIVEAVHVLLPAYLGEKAAVGGLKFEGTLEEQEPLKIDDKGVLSTIKEHWRWDNCEKSLAKKGMYEAPGSLFWFFMGRTQWLSLIHI